MVDRSVLDSEIRRNYETFQTLLVSLLETDRGRFCLLRNGAVVEKFDTASDAHKAGQRLFGDGLFSIQEITDTVADLGYFSHAMPRG
ncbi:MAG: hypothetical protein GC168_13990 [Candidatus Hydrogenedens sp.]|nr:hypothetical protein [Candidatus Hydrogenedens sp.]